LPYGDNKKSIIPPNHPLHKFELPNTKVSNNNFDKINKFLLFSQQQKMKKMKWN